MPLLMPRTTGFSAAVVSMALLLLTPPGNGLGDWLLPGHHGSAFVGALSVWAWALHQARRPSSSFATLAGSVPVGLLLASDNLFGLWAGVPLLLLALRLFLLLFFLVVRLLLLRLLLVLRLLVLLLLILLLLLLLEQFLQFFQLVVIRIKFQPHFHLLLRLGNAVGNVKLRAAVEKIIGGRKLRAGILP